MKGSTCINLSEELYLEIEYDYTPEGPRLHYDQPPDPEELEIERVWLCGIWEIGPDKNKWVRLDITSEAEDLSTDLDLHNIREKSLEHVKNSTT